MRSPCRCRTVALLAAGLSFLAVPSALAASPADVPSFLDRGIPDPGAQAAPASQRAGRALRRTLGRQGVVDLDARTDTPRVVARLDGFLTAPVPGDPETIVLDYVRDHPATFGLDAGDLARLKLVRRYTAGHGIVHLAWAQTYGGIPAVGSQLIANVARDGRIINVLGSPKPNLAVPSTAPDLDAGEALARARTNVGAPLVAPRAQGGTGPRRATRFAGGDQAELVVFVGDSTQRLAWDVKLTSGDGELVDTTVDAASGRVLRRINLTKEAVNAKVFDYHPGASGTSGTQQTVDLNALGYIANGASALDGPYAHAWADKNDSADNTPGAGEEVTPGSYTISSAFAPTNGHCPAAGCTWNLSTGWTTNVPEVTTQLFYYVSKFHDHLAAAPISFTEAKGAFEGTDAAPDKLLAQADDGAQGSGGVPNSDHVNNANMSTPPDGQSPVMQMYLFGDLYGQGPFSAVNGGDDATIVYHEYTHGLTGRLVTDPSGNGALNSAQAGAMGEAWSDWYAMDFLAAQGYAVDTGAPGDVQVGAYVDGGQHLIRFQGLDCPVGSSGPACPGTTGAGAGGFTYGDFGKVYSGGSEVHADGEIWGETLWDLRQALGSTTAEDLITVGLELSPPEPSFLDMRNAILQADTASGGTHRATLWNIFKARGLGFFASTSDSSDTTPVEDFSGPPDPAAGTGAIHGTVSSVTGAVAGATVRLGGHSSGFAGDLVATTAGDGSYTIAGVPSGTYPQLIVDPIRGHDRLVAGPLAVTANATSTANLTLVRDWAAAPGGASIATFNGGDFSQYGCGPAAMIDQKATTQWSANITSPQASFTVTLPQAVDVTGFAVNPTAGCGDDLASSLGGYRIEVSSSSPTSGFTQVAAGAFNGTNLNRTNPVAVAGNFAGNVRYVRLTALSPMDPNSGSGLSYVDATEFEVFGVPVGGLVPSVAVGDATGIGNTTVTLNGTVTPDGLSTSYKFDYGTSTGYGSSTVPGSAGAGTSAQAVTSPVANLAPGTTYHYRLTATNAAGTSASTDRTFTTTGATPIDKTRPKAKLSVARLQKIHAIRVTVTSDEAGSVLATATASSISLRPRGSKLVTLGRRTARLSKPGKVRVKIKLTKSATRRLKRARRRSIKVTVRIVVTDKAGNATALRKTIRLKR